MTNIKTPDQWQAETQLSQLGIAFWPQVVQELFGVLPPALAQQDQVKLPQTLGELARVADLPLAEVSGVLRRVLEEAADIEIDAVDLQSLNSEQTILLDVRTRAEYERRHLPGSILLHEVDFAELLPRLRQSPAVIFICEHGIRSVSAAMYLRGLGVKQAQSLRGGITQLPPAGQPNP